MTDHTAMPDDTAVPPHDLGAERAVLDAMMISTDAAVDVGAILTPADFYRPAHQIVFEAVNALMNRSEPHDALAVHAELVRTGNLLRVGGPAKLAELTDAIPFPRDAAYYARIVKDRALLRRLIEVGTHAAQLGYGGRGEALDVVDRVQGEIMALTEGTATRSGTRADALMAKVADGAQARASRGPGTLVGIPSGFADLDALTSGFLGGQLIIIGARPTVGKTTLSLDIARATARAGHPTAFFSLEMGEEELGQKLVSAEGKIPLHIIKDSSLMREADWERMGKASMRIAQMPLIVHDKFLRLSEIRAEIRRLHRTEGLRLVVIDYLQLVQTESKENRTQEIGEISRALKQLARELEITIIAPSQLNRGSEQRQDKRPQLSELRESGNLEQDSDIVILIYREDVHDKESPRAGEADLIVAKHRNGSTADVTVAFQGHYSRFVDMAPA